MVSALTPALSCVPLVLPAVVGMVLFAISLMLLLISLLAQLLMALLADASALSVREDALPLAHEALSHDCMALPAAFIGAAASGSLVEGVDCAWVSAGTAAMAVIKAAVAAMDGKAFIWIILVEAEGERF